MASYLLIESRDPFETNDTRFCHDLARSLKERGEEVTLFLVQNGVLPARAGAKPNGFAELAAAGVEVLADEFALRERSIPSDRLAPGVKAAPLDIVVERMEQGSKAIWH